VWVTLTAAVLFTGLVLGLPPGVRADPHSADTAVFINISANPALSFAPDSFSVPPGTTVHLVITQMSDFNHTFTLASVVNDTIASGTTPTQLAAFFHQHPPIVNVSLGPTVGEQYPVEFIAPATLGSYEFLCLIHFPTMTGTMTVGSPSSSSTTTSLGWIEYAGIGAAGAIVLVAIGVLIWSRARHKGPSAGVPPTGM
jgi:plastocyanin